MSFNRLANEPAILTLLSLFEKCPVSRFPSISIELDDSVIVTVSPLLPFLCVLPLPLPFFFPVVPVVVVPAAEVVFDAAVVVFAAAVVVLAAAVVELQVASVVAFVAAVVVLAAASAQSEEASVVLLAALAVLPLFFFALSARATKAPAASDPRLGTRS